MVMAFVLFSPENTVNQKQRPVNSFLVSFSLFPFLFFLLSRSGIGSHRGLFYFFKKKLVRALFISLTIIIIALKVQRPSAAPSTFPSSPTNS